MVNEITRGLVVEAAAKYIYFLGYSDLSLAVIAKKCELNEEALRFCFPTKLDLARAAVKHIIKLNEDFLFKWNKATYLSPWSRLINFFNALCIMLKNEDLSWSLWLGIFSENNEFLEIVKEYNHFFLNNIILYTEAVMEGLDPFRSAVKIVALIGGWSFFRRAFPRHQASISMYNELLRVMCVKC